VGVVAQDQYLVWVRDAVVFPSGAKGTYDRFFWQNSLGSPQGVAVLPVQADGCVVLNCKGFLTFALYQAETRGLL